MDSISTRLAYTCARIDELEPFRDRLTNAQRIRLLSIALNYPPREGIYHITISESDELEELLKKHLRA